MKVTRHQLRRIIQELNYLGMADDPQGIDAASEEYNRGKKDAIDGFPPDLSAAANYEAGYEAGINDTQPEEPRELLRWR